MIFAQPAPLFFGVFCLDMFCFGTRMAVEVSEDTTVQPYQFEPESDPEQDEGRKEICQLRLEQVVSEWMLNVMSL